MNKRWVRGCYFKNYGHSLMLSVGVPLPVLNEKVVVRCAVQDKDLVAPVVDLSIPRQVPPTFGLVSYTQIKSGKIVIDGKLVRVASLASVYLSKQVAQELKQWIDAGKFTLTTAVASITKEGSFLPQDSWRKF